MHDYSLDDYFIDDREIERNRRRDSKRHTAMVVDGADVREIAIVLHNRYKKEQRRRNK